MQAGPCGACGGGQMLGAEDQDFAFNAAFLRQKLAVRRLGTNGSTAKAVKLLKHWQQHADAIGLGVVKDSYAVGSRRYVEKDSARMKDAVTRVPLTTGGRLNDILQEWALRHVQNKLGNYFNNANVLFFSGRTNFSLALTMSEYTQNLRFADALLQLGVPKLLTSLDALELYASGVNALSAMDAALQAMVPLAAAAAGLRALAYDIVYQGASAPEREGADTEYHTRTATWRFACLTDRNALT